MLIATLTIKKGALCIAQHHAKIFLPSIYKLNHVCTLVPVVRLAVGSIRASTQDLPVKLGFQDVIFAMKDVDAASAIVERRD